MKINVTEGWIARDGDTGQLWLFEEKPIRDYHGYKCWVVAHQGQWCTRITNTSLLNIKQMWEDEPRKIKITVELIEE